jgi:PhzF family phenazine biosynthesis protein
MLRVENITTMRLYQVDSFTSVKFKGNPAGVCLLDKFPDASLMQSIAMEMNLSETAFVEISDNSFYIRYFTPTQEVPLCGHATLASAHILYELGIVQMEKDFVFKAQDENLQIKREDDWIMMNFPVYQLSKANLSLKFDNIIGIKSIETYKSDNDWIVALVDNEKELLGASPDFEAINKENLGMLIAVTSKSDSSDFDFVVRVFCNPVCGITEDPVTGSANCILAPYWNQKSGKTIFHSKQLSKRTGELKTELTDNRVNIYGQAKTVFIIEMNDG